MKLRLNLLLLGALPTALLMALLVALAACSAPTAPPPSPTTAPSSPEAARQALANELGIAVDKIVVQYFAEAEWSDACLELPFPDETCERVLTRGLSGILFVPDTAETFEFRMNSSATVFRFIPGAVTRAQDFLVQQTGIDPDSIRLVSAERVDWPNSCLSIPTTGACAQIVTPGYRISLNAGGEIYVLHTDRSGERVLMATEKQTTIGEPALVWTSAQGDCLTASLYTSAALFGACEGKPTKGIYPSPQRGAELTLFAARYASFEAETAAGRVQFTGFGPQEASPAEQRMIAEWGWLATQELTSGRGGAAWGLAFSWHREGGIAGFCDDVAVYRTGIAVASSCVDTSMLGTAYLTAVQLDNLYRWVDTLKVFEYSQTDTATADAMTVRLLFSGTGAGEPSDNEKQAMLALAGEVVAQLRTPQNAADIALARQALGAYLAALNQQDYALAAQLYGGSYEALIAANPAISSGATRALFDAACNTNGYVCTLRLGTLADETQVGADEFRFTVTLLNPDGSLFQRGPCCGDDSAAPPQTRFEFRVKNLDGQFLVITLPPYVP